MKISVFIAETTNKLRICYEEYVGMMLPQNFFEKTGAIWCHLEENDVMKINNTICKIIFFIITIIQYTY